MEKTYRIELKDYLQINDFLVSRTPRLKWIRVFRRTFAPAVTAIFMYFLHTELLLSLAVIAVIGILVYLGQRNNLQQTFKSGYAPDLAGACAIAITPEKFLFENSVYEVSVRWEKMSEVTQSPKHIIFMLLTLRSFVIPKSAFPDEEHARIFLETALAYQAGTLTTDVSLPSTTAWPPPPKRRE